MSNSPELKKGVAGANIPPPQTKQASARQIEIRILGDQIGTASASNTLQRAWQHSWRLSFDGQVTKTGQLSEVSAQLLGRFSADSLLMKMLTLNIILISKRLIVLRFSVILGANWQSCRRWFPACGAGPPAPFCPPTLRAWQ